MTDQKIPQKSSVSFEIELKDINYDALRLLYGEDFFPKRPQVRWYQRALQWPRRLVR